MSQSIITFFLDHDSTLHIGTCQRATTMGAGGDTDWARAVLTARWSHACPCLIADVVPNSGQSHTRPADPRWFVAAVNAELGRRIGFDTSWQDLVGDWPEADFRERADVNSAVDWILWKATR